MDSEEVSRWVYLVGSPDARPVKIGVAADPESRLGELRTGSPVALYLIWKTQGGRTLESALHAHFDSYRLHGEWFDFGDENPAAVVASAAVLMGYVTYPARLATVDSPPDLPEPIKLARAAFADAGDPRRMTSAELYTYVASREPRWESADGRGRERFLKALRDSVSHIDRRLDMTTRQWSGGRGYYLDTVLELTGETLRNRPRQTDDRRRARGR